MDRLHPHRRLIVAPIVVALFVAACGNRETGDIDEAPAPAIGRGTRADPPPGISAPSGGGSSGDVAPGPGCPSQRTMEWPANSLTEDDVLGATGIYRPCFEPNALEIRWDEAAGKLHWYRLDDRFVRIQSWEGTIEVVSCEPGSCTVKWTDRGLQSRTHYLELWRDPLAFRLSGAVETGGVAQEWVRIAD